MISKLAKRRILKLAEYMASLPKSANEHFDMRTWFRHEGDHPIKGGDVTREVLKDCGTSACALGWACTIPSFRKAGLRMPVNRPQLTYAMQAHKFFGLNCEKGNDLFGNGAKTPKEWARLARQLVKEWAA